MSARTKTEPVTYVATIEAPSPIAEAVAAKLEAAESPAAMAVTLFECGPGQIEVSAHYAEEPSRERLIQLIEGVAADADVGARSGSSRFRQELGGGGGKLAGAGARRPLPGAWPSRPGQGARGALHP